MEKEKKHIKKTWIKWVAALVMVLLIVAGLRLMLKSDWFFEKVKGIAIEQVNNQINGTLTVDRIRGDIFHGFTVSGVRLTDGSDEEIATIDSVSVSYSLFSVIRSPHHVDKLSVWGMNAYIEQDQDSVWNVMKLAGLDEPEDELQDLVFWNIDSVSLNQINLYISSEHLFPDGFLNVVNLNGQLATGFFESGFRGSLHSLEFGLEEARLPETIDVYLAGAAEGDRYTLESLLLNTGRTVLSANAEYFSDSVEAEANITPLSTRDLVLYVEELPLQQDLTVEVSAEGSMNNLTLTISAAAEGMRQLRAAANLSVDTENILKEFELSIDNIDGPLLTGIENLPSIEGFRFAGSGNILFSTIKESDWSGSLNISGFRFEDYAFDRLNADYNLRQASFDFDGILIYRDEEISLSAQARDIWSESPDWEALILSENLNLATWLRDPEMDSNLNIRGELKGTGIDDSQVTAQTNLSVYNSRFGNQPFSEVLFNGEINTNQIEGDLSGRLSESELIAQFKITEWQEIPSYNFEIALNKFNAEEIVGLEDFPTYLNGTLTGEGYSFDPETMQLSATAAFDSSFVNREEIQTLRADFRIENSELFINDALLESPIADASFSVKQNIINLTDPGNTLTFLATLKDLQPLAPLFGLNRLESKGTVAGRLARGESGYLQFDGNLDLEEISVDSLFKAERVIGNVTAYLFDDPELDMSIELVSPFINESGVQDVTFSTYTTLAENETFGSIGFKIVNDEESSLTHGGEFSADSVGVRLITDQFDFTTGLRTLSLVNPFELTLIDDIIRLDTLAMQSPNGNAYLKLWAPHVDSLKQHIGLDARDLNLGALQSIVFEEPLFEGLLSGRVEVNNAPDQLEVSGSGLFTGLSFESGQMDSIRFGLDLKDEWLEGHVEGWRENSELFKGDLKVPFIVGDPLTFDNEFFDREVEGRFELFESDLKYWFSFLPDGQFEETEGIISFYADLKGLAGNPELDGKLAVRDGVFSGIGVDSVGVDLMYLHENEEVEFEGLVISHQRPIVDFDARLPFKVDLRQAEILLPGEEDSVLVNLKTENFDLAIFNDFVDRDVIRQVSGRLNGEVSLAGQIADLQPRGRMELTNGSMRIVPAGITLAEVGSIINFEPNRVELQQFSMRSGPGRIRANGTVDIENLTPGNISLDIRGSQFRAANTSEYNATIDLSANLRGTVAEPVVTGNLTFLNGFVNLQNFGERAVEDVRLEDEEEPDPIEFYDAMAIEMNVRFARQFFIRNRQFLDMEIELGGNVDLVKESYRDLQMFGSLEGVRGYARPLGKNFELDEALISFYGPVDNPELNIITRFNPPQAQSEVRIYYIIEGTVQDPDFRFDSEPQLELQDIISYTLFGKPFYELESWEQVVAGSGGGSSATDLALEVLLDRVEMLASQRLGIDVVQIDNTGSGSSSTTSIKTGWYLNRRTFFAILNEISSTRPKTLFILEYLLTENLELILTQGDDSREGVDLRWKHDY